MTRNTKIALGIGAGIGALLWLTRKKWTAMLNETSMKKLSEILPHVRNKAVELAGRAQAEGITIGFNTGYRSPEAQQKAYEGGKSGAPGGKGWHGVRRALDFYVIVDGKKRFDALDSAIRPLYERVGVIAESIGFRWLGFKTLTAGNKKPFQDPYHIEMRDGLTIAQATERIAKGVDKV